MRAVRRVMCGLPDEQTNRSTSRSGNSWRLVNEVEYESKYNSLGGYGEAVTKANVWVIFFWVFIVIAKITSPFVQHFYIAYLPNVTVSFIILFKF